MRIAGAGGAPKEIVSQAESRTDPPSTAPGSGAVDLLQIEAVRMEGGDGHGHVTGVQWRDPETGQSGRCSRAEMVSWINGGNRAYVVGESGKSVAVLIGAADPPYLRTRDDGRWTDDLLGLGRY